MDAQSFSNDRENRDLLTDNELDFQNASINKKLSKEVIKKILKFFFN
jgi:hypothetical protein